MIRYFLMPLILWLAAMLAVGRAAEPAAKELPPGFRQIAGKHLTLVTDLPANPEVDGLPEFFDLAFEPWCKLLAVDAKAHDDWHVTGYLMKSRERFENAGLMSKNVPNFKNGYADNYELWLYDQTSPYYRRHLLLHEGVHSFMSTLLGSCGPPWYAEGMAELLGTHRLVDERLEVAYFPQRKTDVPGLGRIRIVKDAYAAHRTKSLREILAYDARAHLENEPYGWCWAAAAFLDGHPRYQERFRKLRAFVKRDDFSERFLKLYAADFKQLNEEWQVFISLLVHNYDFARMAIDFVPGKPLPAAGASVTVAADRGWQSSKLKLEAGKTYQLTASGRYQVAKEASIWWSEPNGVTIRYYNGQPLGTVMAAVRPDKSTSGPSALETPTVIGQQATLTPEVDGTLYLRINDSAGKLADNAGTATVQVAPR